jgi:peptidoglycan/LPS O-acetylase OafA/YrhL
MMRLVSTFPPADLTGLTGQSAVTDGLDSATMSGVSQAPEPVISRRARGGADDSYLPGLDGLRAAAVLAVIAYHAGAPWARGGYLGVEVFFVVSGFLITRLLVNEAAANGRVSLAGFWTRRARRLLPALFTMLAAVSAYLLAAHSGEVATFRGDLSAALAYVSNWFQIYGDHSYFAELGRPSPFRHLWSLAVEEQFYLLWPPILLGLAHLCRGRRQRVAVILVALAAAANIVMALKHDPSVAPDRVYLGTDMRASGLLLGAVTALVWRPRALALRRTQVADVCSASAALLLIVACWRLRSSSNLLYHGGFAVIDLATIALIVASTATGSWTAKAMSWPPMVAVGKRSYGLYLWHWPVLALSRQGTDTQIAQPWLWFIRAGLTVVLSEACYRFVETPIRRGALGRWWSRLVQLGTVRQHRLRTLHLLPALSIAAAASVLTVGVATRSAHPNEIAESIKAGEALLASLASTTTVPATTTTMLPATTTLPPTSDPTASTDPFATTTVASTTTTAPPVLNITAVGDSVMLGAAPALVNKFGARLAIDAKVNRQYRDGLAIVDQQRQDLTLGEVVVVHLGNNGPFSQKQFDEMMAKLSDRAMVVFVLVHVAKPWENTVNDVLNRNAPRFPKLVRLMDWARIAGEHPEFIHSDGTHLRSNGAAAYAELMNAVISGPVDIPPGLFPRRTTSTTTTIVPTTVAAVTVEVATVPTAPTVPSVQDTVPTAPQTTTPTTVGVESTIASTPPESPPSGAG